MRCFRLYHFSLSLFSSLSLCSPHFIFNIFSILLILFSVLSNLLKKICPLSSSFLLLHILVHIFFLILLRYAVLSFFKNTLVNYQKFCLIFFLIIVSIIF
jgi:hypothetical protein